MSNNDSPRAFDLGHFCAVTRCLVLDNCLPYHPTIEVCADFNDLATLVETTTPGIAIVKLEAFEELAFAWNRLLDHIYH